MATLNVNIPRFYCLLRKEFLYDGTAHHNEFDKVCVFGVASVSGERLGFMFSRKMGRSFGACRFTPCATRSPSTTARLVAILGLFQSRNLLYRL